MDKKVLWSKGIWTITEVSGRQVMIDNHNGKTNWHIDYAIVYDSGKVAYENNPYAIPQYVKDKVEKILTKKLEEIWLENEIEKDLKMLIK